MSDEPFGADFGLLMRQQREMLSEIRTMRGDMSVLAAIVQRMDGTLSGLVNEIRATHSQLSRMDRRVCDLETR